MSKIFDVAVIGGGIVGAAAAMALTRRFDCSLILLETEKQMALHQTGNNSGVIHSGLYYKPGSLKAKNCAAGREKFYRFCEEHGIAHDRCGKVVVATSTREIPYLNALEKRGRANGLIGLKRLTGNELDRYEPCVAGIDGLLVPETGIVDYKQATKKYAEIIRSEGGKILTSRQVTNCSKMSNGLLLDVSKGESIQCRYMINCGGLQSDRIARMCGVNPGVRIIPFRGEYYELRPERQHLVKNLIYPVPDPRFPFLGVHFTRMIHGGVEAGPNAVLAFKREGYGRFDFSPKDSFETFAYSGFWRMALPNMKMGMGEMYRSMSKSAFVKALQRLIPELQKEDVRRGGAGVRAQAVDSKGKLVDDFRIVEAKRMIHVLNAPSPAATASISIGETISDIARKRFDLKPK
ncbi:MAG: hydroxyglutarate oxidase [Candidatus Cloacimonetes bacterium 4572_55]|nr:MAG: hydroxyglutarate oxidase [Candidatus Cloacimonetes bacterium 4572_55]